MKPVSVPEPMPVPEKFTVFLLLMLALAVPACKRSTAIDGLENWRFGQTTAKDGIACSPRNQYTFCSQNGAMNVAGYTGQVNLFFKGQGDDAPLIEIELEFMRCDPDKVRRALLEKLGPNPEKVADYAVMWPGERAIILARLPAEDGICLVHFVIPDDKQRLDELRADARADGIKPGR